MYRQQLRNTFSKRNCVADGPPSIPPSQARVGPLQLAAQTREEELHARDRLAEDGPLHFRVGVQVLREDILPFGGLLRVVLTVDAPRSEAQDRLPIAFQTFV